MAASPPPLKRQRLSLGASHFSVDTGLSERTVAASHPIAFAPTIAGLGTTAVFGGVRCPRCVDTVAKVAADRADPLKANSEFDTCFLCCNAGHWSSACPLHWCGSCDVCTAPPAHTPVLNNCKDLQKTGWIVRGIVDDVQNHTTEAQVLPSLLELSTRAVANLPVEQFLRNDIEIPSHVAAADVVPRLPFRLIDRFYYEQPPQLSGAVTTETHAVAMRRFYACAAHVLSENSVEHLSKGTDIPLWDVFGDSKLLFSERMNHRGAFEEGGKFLFADAPPRRVVADVAAALANFNRLSCGLVDRDVLESDEVVVAGGSVLGALVLDPATAVQDSSFKSSDIDLFILGQPTVGNASIECLAQMTIVRVVSNYKRMYPEGKYAIVSRAESSGSHVQNGCVATCFFEGEGLPTVQIILRSSIRSPVELLATFDVDCCGVALVQGRFVASSLAARALAHGYNIFNPTFAQRKTLIPRLHKYAQRGFPVFVPMKASDLIDSTSDDVLLKYLCSPYVGDNEDVCKNVFYEATKIPEGCTTVRALVTALGGNADVAIAHNIDDCIYGTKFTDDGQLHRSGQCHQSAHILCGTWMVSQDIAEVCHVPEGGFPEHPLLAPIVFPCSLDLIKNMVRLKIYSDEWRREHSSSSSVGVVSGVRDAFLNPQRPPRQTHALNS